MVCFFSRADGVIRCEVRLEPGGDGYELVIARPDAMVRVERFSCAASLNERWADVERRLIRQGWRGPDTREPRRAQPRHLTLL